MVMIPMMMSHKMKMALTVVHQRVILIFKTSIQLFIAKEKELRLKLPTRRMLNRNI
jgi:hypothetical protein